MKLQLTFKPPTFDIRNYHVDKEITIFCIIIGILLFIIALVMFLLKRANEIALMIALFAVISLTIGIAEAINLHHIANGRSDHTMEQECKRQNKLHPRRNSSILQEFIKINDGGGATIEKMKG